MDSSIKKKIKQMIPSSVLSIVENYRRARNLKMERIKECESPEFKRRKIFYSQFLHAGDTYFDIGANYGNRIAPVITLSPKKIVAVEPQKKCCEVLKAKYPEIIVLQMGVGAKSDVKDFFLSNDSVLSSFSTEFISSTKDTRFIGHTWENSEKVNIITLDKLISMYGVPDFIKIDVEGYELEVIMGLNQKVKCLSLEYTVPELEHNLAPICSKLISLGSCWFNYSIGESMELSLPNWLSSGEIATFLKSDVFRSTGFGDLYVRYSD